MAESSGSDGNGSGLNGLNVAAPDFVEQGKAQGQGLSLSGWFDDIIRKYVLAHVSGPGSIISGLASVFDDLIAVYVAFIGQAQAKDSPGLFTLLAEVLGDLIGVELDSNTIAGAWKRSGQPGAFKAVGAALWNALVSELGSPSTLTPQSGLAAAQGFMGYLLGFSVREGNIALLSSIIPEELRFLEGIDEYPRAMRASLGFGRMARQALHPLIQTLITDPLQWWVNETYTPKLLGESAAIRAYNRGKIDAQTLSTEMAYAGYSSTRAGYLQEDGLTHLTPSDAYTLYKHGRYNSTQLSAAYQNAALDPSTSGDWLAARILADVEPWIAALIVDWKTQALTGYITLSTFNGFIDSLGLLPDVANALKNSVSQLFEFPRRKLSLAEVQSAFVEGLLDSTDVAAFLKGEGYSDDDQLTLWYQTLLKLGSQEAKVAVAQYTYAKAVKKAEAAGEAPPPPPAILAETPLENPFPKL